MNLVSAGTGTIIQSGAQLLEDGATLLRLRGAFHCMLASVDSIAGGYVGSIGVGIVTAQAFAIGVTACPTPEMDAEWDGWLFWMPVFCKTITATIGDAINAGVVSQRIEVDSKAMRKLRLGDTIYAVFEGTETGTSTINLAFDSRVLLALS